MSVETRGSAARAAAGSVVNAAANLAREQISAEQVLQWTMEGKVYTGSVEPETAGISGGTAVIDTTQQFTLRSDKSGTKLVIPIFMHLCFTDKGTSAVANVVLAMTRPWNDTAVLTTESGTALTVLNNRGDGYGNHTATALHTVTVAALDGTGDWTEIARWLRDNSSFESTSLAPDGNSIFVHILRDLAPIVLYKGSMLGVQYYAAAAPSARVTFQWAELDAATYLP